jgi:hypothetical protein
MLREASAYFAGEGRLHGALRRLTQRLNAEGIPYAESPTPCWEDWPLPNTGIHD